LSCQLDQLKLEAALNGKKSSEVDSRSKLISYLREQKAAFKDLRKGFLPPKPPPDRRSIVQSSPGFIATFKGEDWFYHGKDRLDTIIGSGAYAGKLKRALANEGLMGTSPGGGNPRFVVSRPAFRGKGKDRHAYVCAFKTKIIEERQTAREEVGVFASRVNGRVALWTHAQKVEPAPFIARGFHHCDEYYAWRLDWYADGVDLIKALRRTGFVIPRSNLTQIISALKHLRKPDGLLFATPSTKLPTLKNFFLLQFKPNRRADTLRLYPVIWNYELYLCASIPTQPQAMAKLSKLPKDADVRRFEKEHALFIKFYETKKSAILELRDLAKTIDIPEVDRKMEAIRKMRTVDPAS